MVIGVFVVARDGVMLGVFQVPVSPAIGRVRAEIRTTGRGSGDRGWGWCNRGWSDGARGRGCGDDTSVGGASGVGSVKAGGARGGRQAAILVGGPEMGDEGRQGFVSLWFGAPVATRDVEQASGEDEIITEADDRGGGRSIVASRCEPDAVVELSEQLVDWGRWMPRCMHT